MLGFTISRSMGSWRYKDISGFESWYNVPTSSANVSIYLPMARGLNFHQSNLKSDLHTCSFFLLGGSDQAKKKYEQIERSSMVVSVHYNCSNVPPIKSDSQHIIRYSWKIAESDNEYQLLDPSLILRKIFFKINLWCFSLNKEE
jgi:hypothetical protein